ncbi:MAG: methyltransferase domain-containing protein [Ardenticatenaceae bacterium]|nr:methyltransferase domain-containing protein [Ardenticatenaceae bacterium]
MTYLLFPGRHLLNTSFQAQYLRRVLQMPLDQLDFLPGKRPPDAQPLDQVVFAVTSSNQAHSRYNPIPFYVRAIGVDRFIRPFETTLAIHYRILGIPHYPPTPRFAEFTLKEIAEQTEGQLALTPDNCVVLCSTTAVIEQYRQLGFAILPAELGHPERPPTPIEVLQKMVATGENWATNSELRDLLHPATFDLWQDFPEIPRRIFRLWRDPLLNDEGGLTEDRNYAAYAYGMSNAAILELKYQDIREAIVPGKIVDEGCADGALLALIARDFPDSDLIGIDIAAEFIARCREGQRAGDFGGSFVFFHQRNIIHPIFEPGSIHTTICNSTLHELWSYGDQAQTVQRYLALKFAQTAVGGRLLIRDVVGPEQGEREVYLWLNHEDGSNEDVFHDLNSPGLLAEHLERLSTYGRFLRFARDFLPQRQQGQPIIRFREEMRDGRRFAILPLRHACEFMSKKDYTTNWASEMHEEFAFWSFSDWKQALQTAGFRVLENPNTPLSGSRVYTNPWIVSQRWESKVALYEPEGNGRLVPLPYPPTNVILAAERSG